ncbi:MAG: acyl-CoA dehydratase activase-related protein [Candidatus Pacearchaeota archaeon]
MAKESSFKGLEVSEMTFERKKSKCSEIIKDSCGARDCNLEIYKLGNDTIFTGGLCPKGNTELTFKKTPDYIKIYLNILESHLNKITHALDDSCDYGPRILIPRAMSFLNERGIFYASIYHNLGFDVRISPESNEEISDLGKMYSHSEFCYPVILAHGHAAYLKQKLRKEDKLLLLDVISVSDKKYKYCPYVASAGHIISANIRANKEQVLIPVIYFDDKNFPIHKSIYDDLNRVFPGKFSIKQVINAVKNAEKDHEEFLKEVYKKGSEIIEELNKNGEKIYVGIARGYTMFDLKASSEVNKLFVNNGLYFIPSYMIDVNDRDIDKIVQNMYWYQGRKMLERMWYSLEKKNMFPVRLTNFNCGPDSIVYYHEEKLANDFNKPWLVLETDGHNSNAQFSTRILAHDRVVNKYLENPREGNLKILFKRDNDFKDKIIGLPYMSDSSDILAAAFISAGFNAVVMPTRTKESIEISKKIVKTNTCHPFSFQVGDHLAWLDSMKKKGIPQEKIAVFIPTAKGPCRFGQYSAILRNLYDERGYDKVTIINPSSTSDYTDINISSKKALLITKIAYQGVLANELLKNCLLRIRPYEINKGESDKLYDKAHNEIIELIKTKPSISKIKKFLIDKRKEFELISRNDKERFPLVLVNGEIFVRAHEKANLDSIRLLEEHGLEVILEPIFSWMNYVNKNVIKKSKKNKNFKQLGKSLIKKIYMEYVEKKFTKPFKELLKGREFHDSFELIERIEKDLIFDSNIEGEGCLNIAGTYAFIKGELPIDGIYHVSPMGCMQETIATSRIQALIQEKRENSKGEIVAIPFMDAVFAESCIPNLESQIVIFAENCKLRKERRENYHS